jgi:hypothetical protein
MPHVLIFNYLPKSMYIQRNCAWVRNVTDRAMLPDTTVSVIIIYMIKPTIEIQCILIKGYINATMDPAVISYTIKMLIYTIALHFISALVLDINTAF